MLRRSFVASPLALTVSRLRAAAPKLQLGYDTYSLRAWGMKALEHLEFASKHGCNAIQISSLADFESLEPAYLAKVKARAADLGITVDAGTGCICPTARAFNPKNGTAEEQLKTALRAAHLVGARSLRCYLGDSNDRAHPNGIEYHIESTVKVFKACQSVAEETGVKIALENHSGDMQAWEAVSLIEAAGKSYAAICLDTGNPIWCAEHPEVTLEVAGPYTVTTHFRDTAIFAHPRGCAANWTALGDGCVDLKKLAALQKKLAPGAALQLEIITGRPPRIVPYYEDSFWKLFPKARAPEFARFVALVKSGNPLMGPMIIADAPGPKIPEYQTALKRQQMLDLQRSLQYAAENLV